MEWMTQRSRETPNLGIKGDNDRSTESLHTSPYTSLRFIPTLHETGLRRNPSTVSYCAQKYSISRELVGKVRWAHTFLGVLEYKGVATEDGGNEDLELQVREVLTHTPPIIHDDRIVSFLMSGTKFDCFADLGPYENGLNVF